MTRDFLASNNLPGNFTPKFYRQKNTVQITLDRICECAIIRQHNNKGITQ